MMKRFALFQFVTALNKQFNTSTQKAPQYDGVAARFPKCSKRGEGPERLRQKAYHPAAVALKISLPQIDRAHFEHAFYKTGPAGATGRADYKIIGRPWLQPHQSSAGRRFWLIRMARLSRCSLKPQWLSGAHWREKLLAAAALCARVPAHQFGCR